VGANKIYFCLAEKDNGEDRLNFLCEVDVGGNVPESWEEALALLRKNYANDMVVRCIPQIFGRRVVILTVTGVYKMFLSYQFL